MARKERKTRGWMNMRQEYGMKMRSPGGIDLAGQHLWMRVGVHSLCLTLEESRRGACSETRSIPHCIVDTF